MEFPAALNQSLRMAAGLVRGRMPLTLAYILPTLKCNLRCAYCSAPDHSGSELPTRTWLGIIDDLARRGCRQVVLTGGEPLLRPDITDIIGRVKSRGMSCVLNSNGLLIGRLASKLASLDMLILSLDAAGPENDRLRGEGVFEAVRQAARAARSAGTRVKVNVTLSGANVHVLDRLLDFASAEGLFLSCNVVRSAEASHSRRASGIRAEEGALRSALKRLAELSASGAPVLYSREAYLCASRWPDFSRDLYRRGDIESVVLGRLGHPRCHAGKAFLAIGPEGGVSPCTLTVGRGAGGNAAREGVARARDRTARHDCLACHSTCMIELNLLFSLKPAVLAGLLLRQRARLS